MSLVFYDTFTGAVATNLQLHAPDTGTSWTELWATTTGSGLNASGGLAVGDGGVNDSGAIYTADGTYDCADYFVQVTMTSLDPSTSDPFYLLLRVQDQENMYAVKIMDQNGSGTCSLYKKVSGIWTALGTAFDPPANGSVLKFEVIGNTLTLYDDGIAIRSVTDTSITATGKAGLAIGGGAELQDSTNNIDASELDNFRVYTTGASYEFLYVTGEGAITTGWLDGPAPTDYTKVDETGTHDGDTTFLYTPLANSERTFALQNPSSVTGTIHGLFVHNVVKALDPSSATIQNGARIGGTTYYDTASKDTINNNTTYVDFVSFWETNPNTGLAWTLTDLNNVESAIKKINTAGQRLTQSYAKVGYGTGGGGPPPTPPTTFSSMTMMGVG